MYHVNLLRKLWHPKQWFYFREKKAPSARKKKKFFEKNPSNLFARVRSSKRCAEFS